ncbi:hypothetical protein Bca101_009894 [Brassica carinata]
MPDKPSSEDPEEIQSPKWSVRKAKKTNRERHSLRCDVELKLSTRNSLSLHAWLKIHLANLYAGGVEKLSHDGRLAFVENHVDDIIDSPENAIHGKRWWLKAEDSSVFSVMCHSGTSLEKSFTLFCNLPLAYTSGKPHKICIVKMGHAMVYNIMKLWEESFEAAAINLVAGENQLMSILKFHGDRVHEIMKKDNTKDPESNPTAALAKILINQVSRQEAGKADGNDVGIWCHLSKGTLAALGEIFEAARAIMSWLGDCAKVQIWLQEGNTVDVRKQRTVFPPNFVHSLDGTHMMMTAVACREAGLNFAGVHDSYWTHACDVDTMNRILREKFVELYSTPILEDVSL